MNSTFESFYGSPPNFSLTKSSVSKPAPRRISCNMVCLDTPTSSIDKPLHTRKCMDTSFSIVSFRRAAMKRSLKNIAGFWGASVESVLSETKIPSSGRRLLCWQTKLTMATNALIWPNPSLAGNLFLTWKKSCWIKALDRERSCEVRH